MPSGNGNPTSWQEAEEPLKAPEPSLLGAHMQRPKHQAGADTDCPSKSNARTSALTVFERST